MTFQDYKKICNLRKSLLLLASIQVIPGVLKSVLNAIDIDGFNISRLVKEFL
jgi:hypothetical protein